MGLQFNSNLALFDQFFAKKAYCHQIKRMNEFGARNVYFVTNCIKLNQRFGEWHN